MDGVRGGGRGCLVGLVGAAVEVLVVGLVHCFAHPVGHAAGGNREAHVAESLEELCGDVVGAVLVADYSNQSDPVERDHPAGRVCLAQKRVQAFQNTLCMTAGVTHPDRRAEYEDVGVEDLLAYRGPGVAVALIGRDARPDVVFADTDRAGRRDVVGCEGREYLADEFVGAGF